MLIGDPGVGKTYYILQQLLYWRKIGIPAAVFFIEKRRRFYTMRFVAQLEGETGFLDFDWIKANPDRVRDALARHKPLLDALGRDIYSSDGQRVDLDGLLGWITQMASAGKRVIIVDPITAVAAGVERWTKDDDFVAAANDVAERHGASLVLVNHAKKGNRPGAPTGHDQSGGAAYYRHLDRQAEQAAHRPHASPDGAPDPPAAAVLSDSQGAQRQGHGGGDRVYVRRRR
jgi:hypothetical protein